MTSVTLFGVSRADPNLPLDLECYVILLGLCLIFIFHLGHMAVRDFIEFQMFSQKEVFPTIP